MTTTVKNIIPRKYAENTQSAQYTSANVKCIIDKFTVTNISTSTVATFSVNLVAASGSVSDSNLIIDSVKIPPGDTYLCPEIVGQVLEANGFISTLASDANTLTISASGREIS